ncbi:MAG TPA: 4-hydroxythreonine-4-phosphate dehydrogenase PdxA [Gemmatimonadaceae bacterium]|nr:4-hydroxythreonine-4-phosphate dehydrogenase PdxA [Gemmatimonadaceae bacterium]
MTRPRLAITEGDPRGIGPEIVRAALADPRVRAACDAEVIPTGPAGVSEAAAGEAAARAIERAVDLARRGAVQGIVTAPIDKHALLAAGRADPGHTEMLARLTGARTVMMLASDRLRVVLATTHIPLRDVPARLTRETIAETARITRDGLRDWYGIAAPRIALCALNPHAGEQGRFGREEIDTLAPAAAECALAGPFPADTVFVRAMKGEFDAVIAPYHDVGMTAIKVASFGSAVNVTLGLPWPRTSPDHGTAMDIAGTGRADASSMTLAVLECARIAALRRPT